MKNKNKFEIRYIHVRFISTKIHPMKYIYTQPFFYNETNLKNIIGSVAAILIKNMLSYFIL